MNGYAKAMEYQRRLDEKANPDKLTPPRKLINESGVLNALPEDMTELKSKIRGLIYTEEVSNTKRRWLQGILAILERDFIQ